MFSMLKKKKYILLIFQKITQSWKTSYFSIDSKWKGTMALSCISCSKKISTLLGGMTSKNYGKFYCLNCLHSFRKINRIKNIKNKDFCNVIMPFEALKYYNLINIKNLIKHHLLFIQILNV